MKKVPRDVCRIKSTWEGIGQRFACNKKKTGSDDDEENKRTHCTAAERETTDTM